MNKVCGRLSVGLGLMIASISATNGENGKKSAKFSKIIEIYRPLLTGNIPTRKDDDWAFKNARYVGRNHNHLNTYHICGVIQIMLNNC